MTYQTEMIKYKMPHAFVEISPELAQDRDIHEGAEIKLISESGGHIVSTYYRSSERQKKFIFR